MKVTLIRDYPKDGWESIEVYANNLAYSIKLGAISKVDIRDFRSFPKIAATLHTRGQVFKFLYHFVINPLGAFFAQGNLNHIVDQSNAPMLYLLNRKKTIITCHDILSQWYKLRYKNGSILYDIEPLKIATHIIAVSEFTKNELVTKVGINPDNITVIRESVEPFFKPVSDKDKKIVKQRYGLPKRYALHVGSVAPHKNIPFLLRVFAETVKRNEDIYLVKVGANFTDKQQELIRELGVGDRVVTLGFVSRTDLPAIYSGASLYIQPSLIEGFGLTVLEAMSCGCPVFISDIPVFRELFSIGAVFIDIRSLPRSVETIDSILRDPVKQKFYSQLSISNSKVFSPARIGYILGNYYRSIGINL